ncbi:MAG TPA: penicillin-binding protein [Bacteroidota bacterium]|nr:penicillin-binding protein [Bacteroidota bacterium]
MIRRLFKKFLEAAAVTTVAGKQKPVWLNNTQKRLRYLQIGILLFFVVVCLRLAQVQIVNFGTYRDLAKRQYQTRMDLPATRGVIYDRNEEVLASNSMFVSFAADPKVAAEDARAIAAKFSQLFGKPKKYYLDKLDSDLRFVWLERLVNPDILKKVDAAKLEGLIVLYEPRRLYHSDHVAGQLIGFTDIDNNGLAGSELEFDKLLQGVDGYVVLQRDGLGKARPSVDYPRVEPVNGHSVVLTIDAELQSIAEKELQKGVETNKADRGIVIMMKNRTGEILAMGQYPPVDPARFGSYGAEDQKLRAVTDVFEPGSVFKIVTASAALENHLIKPEQKFFAENGKYNVAGRPKPIVDTHEYGWITFQEAMAYSSNIVMAKASDVIGSERLYKMARDYGFGISTNVEFPGEVRGTLKKPAEWSGTTLNTMAYGYEVQVTPLQIASAYCALANDGVLMKPMLIKQELDAQGQVVNDFQPQMIRRVISEATAKTLKHFFQDVVKIGTGKPAAVEGIDIAGKTGTSKKFVEGKYEPGSYTASFVGFYPSEDPQVVCLVMIDNPRAGTYYGGTTSAPVFKAIAERVIGASEMFASVAPQNPRAVPEPAPEKSTQVNNVPVKSAPVKKASAKSAGVSTPADMANVIPDVRGMSVRKAVNMLRMRKLDPVVSGSGTVKTQTPGAGQLLKAGTKIMLVCQQKSLTSLSAN